MNREGKGRGREVGKGRGREGGIKEEGKGERGKEGVGGKGRGGRGGRKGRNMGEGPTSLVLPPEHPTSETGTHYLIYYY